MVISLRCKWLYPYSAWHMMWQPLLLPVVLHITEEEALVQVKPVIHWYLYRLIQIWLTHIFYCLLLCCNLIYFKAEAQQITVMQHWSVSLFVADTRDGLPIAGEGISDFWGCLSPVSVSKQQKVAGRTISTLSRSWRVSFHNYKKQESQHNNNTTQSVISFRSSWGFPTHKPSKQNDASKQEDPRLYYYY